MADAKHCALEDVAMVYVVNALGNMQCQPWTCISGMVQVKLQWSLEDLDVLTAVADDVSESEDHGLDWYGPSGNHPGQPWKCYRSMRYDEKDEEKTYERDSSSF